VNNYAADESGRMKWNTPIFACKGVELRGVEPSSPNKTKLYSPSILATTAVFSEMGLTLKGAVLVYSKLSPGLRIG
jgi:hypothetical protein